jgi:hypothetical protein
VLKPYYTSLAVALMEFNVRQLETTKLIMRADATSNKDRDFRDVLLMLLIAMLENHKNWLTEEPYYQHYRSSVPCTRTYAQLFPMSYHIRPKT